MTTRYVKLRRVRHGPWVPAEICRRDGLISVRECGEETVSTICADGIDAAIADMMIKGASVFADPVIRALAFGVEISKADHDLMVATAAWARSNEPDHPAADPRKPIDLGTMPIRHLF